MGFRRSIEVLIALNLLLVAGLAVVMFLDLSGSSRGHPEQAPVAAAAGQASPSFDLMNMGLAHIPTNNDCVLCHDGADGVDIKVVPAILHPIEGWRRCVTCHTDETLGRAAPGHTGIAEEECLNCHKSGEAGPAITQPHAALQDQRCLTCHGSVAHLPSSMASSKETDCILCHKPTTLPPPAYPHPADARLSCRACHQSEQAGALPIDHALRTDDTCLLCHDIKRTGDAPPVTLPSGSPGTVIPPTQYPLLTSPPAQS
jgi:hypothetical protein